MLNQLVGLERVFHALSDTARLSMLERLSTGPASVSELAQPLAMTLSAVVQHLQVLEGSGLVRSEKRGRVRTCHLETEAMQRAEAWLIGRRANWEQRLEALGQYLENGASGD